MLIPQERANLFDEFGVMLVVASSVILNSLFKADQVDLADIDDIALAVLRLILLEVVPQTLHDAIPGSRLVIMPNVGHLSNVEAPERFNAEVHRFLDALDHESWDTPSPQRHPG